MTIGLLTLAGCGGEQYQDIQEFMREAEKSAPRKIEPLPEVKAYTPFEYVGYDLPEPFRPRKLAATKGDTNGVQPDLNRRKEPLESYPLESLKMVGTLQQGKAVAWHKHRVDVMLEPTCERVWAAHATAGRR